MSELCPLVALWPREAKRTGKTYWVGKMGEARVMMFRVDSENPKAPEFKIFLTEYLSAEEREKRAAELENPPGPLPDDPDIPF